MADHDTHDHTGIPGCGAPADILDIPTAETDTTLVLAPDGAGGVEFRAETGGGGGGGLVLLESHTASAQATLDFATRNASGQSGATFQSDYDTYEIRILGLLPATGGTNLLMRLGTGGGPTYDSGSNYAWTGVREAPGGQATGQGSGGTTSFGLDVSGTVATTAAGGGLHAVIDVFDIRDGTAAPHFAGWTHVWDGSNYVWSGFGGTYLSATPITGMRFLFSSGNIASGTVRIYGVAP